MKRFISTLMCFLLIWPSIAVPSASADFEEGSILDMFQDPSYLVDMGGLEETVSEPENVPEPEFVPDPEPEFSFEAPEAEFIPETEVLPELEEQDEVSDKAVEDVNNSDVEAEVELELEEEVPAVLPENTSRYSIVPHDFMLRDIYNRYYYGRSLSYAEAMNLMAEELSEAITCVVNSVESDEVLVRYNGAFEGTYRNMMTELAAVFCAGEGWSSADKLLSAKLSVEQVNRLHKIYWSMVSLEPLLREELTYSFSEDGSEVLESVYSCLQVDVSILRAADYYAEDSELQAAAEAMLSEESRAALYDICMGRISVSDGKLDKIISELPEDLDENRRQLVIKACSVVGKVPYFWGGKSNLLGWDVRWNVPKFITSSGSDTQGMAKPYGLDCSGYIDWVFINSAGSTDVLSVIGEGTVSQFNNCVVITAEEAQPGDLVFSFGDEFTPNHAGIVVGRTESGEALVSHCTASGSGGVIVEPVSSSGCSVYASPIQFYSVY